jgi:hypothetical protein
MVKGRQLRDLTDLSLFKLKHGKEGLYEQSK